MWYPAQAEGPPAEQNDLAPAAAVGVCRQASCSGVPALPHPKRLLGIIVCSSSALCHSQRLQVLLGWAAEIERSFAVLIP